MQRILDFVNAHYDALCIFVGGLAGFIVTMLKNKETKKSFSAKASEAALCACISASLCQFGIYAFDMSPNLSMFVGTFCGWLGADYIKNLVTSYIESKVKKEAEK